jgi:hypothetical protein
MRRGINLSRVPETPSPTPAEEREERRRESLERSRRDRELLASGVSGGDWLPYSQFAERLRGEDVLPPSISFDDMRAMMERIDGMTNEALIRGDLRDRGYVDSSGYRYMVLNFDGSLRPMTHDEHAALRSGRFRDVSETSDRNAKQYVFIRDLRSQREAVFIDASADRS